MQYVLNVADLFPDGCGLLDELSDSPRLFVPAILVEYRILGKGFDLG